MNGLDKLSQFPQTKAEIQKVSRQWVDEILDGNVDPLVVAIQIKTVQTLLENVLNGIKEYATEEAEKNGKMFETEHAKIEVADLGVKYDYSVCGDFYLASLYCDMIELKEKVKERETMLKTLPDGGMVDPETGEVLHRPNRSGSRGIKITIK